MKIQLLAEKIKGKLIGNGDLEIVGINDFYKAEPNQITLAFESKYQKKINDSRAGSFVTNKDLGITKPQIICEEPRKALGQILQIFNSPKIEFQGISDKAHLEVQVEVAEPITIEAFTYVKSNTKIGKNTYIHNNVSIGKNCVIGQNCEIFPHVTIYDNTVIGDNVIIHTGASIGADGFGYYPDGKKWEKILQIGRVVIGNDVEIGANTCIDRGCLDETYIGNGVKIDNLVQIAHNCRVGDNTIIAALSGFPGGVVFGEHVIVAGQVGSAGHINIGDDVVLLARCAPTKNIPANGVYSGAPAKPHFIEQQNVAIVNRFCKEFRKKENRIKI